MGCENSTAKGTDTKKVAPQAEKKTAAAAPNASQQKPAEKPKGAVPADDATHITAATTPGVTPASPQAAQAEAVKEDEATKKEAAAENAATEEKISEAKAAEAAAAAPAEQPAAEAPADAAAPAAAAETPSTPEETMADAAAAETPEAAAQLATAPAEEELDASLEHPRRHSTAAPIHQASQTQRAADPNSPYAGPGPAESIPIDTIYRCFEEDNGLLFRLVNKKRHMWAFYNDTTEYVMRVSVTFGPESSVTPLDDTQVTVSNAGTGECTMVLDVPPGETKRFMRGEYNGFTTSYDANPMEGFEEKLEAPEDEPVVQPLQFASRTAEATSEGENVPLEDASDGGTRIHFMETDPNKEEAQDDLKKRREEA